ncbi:MAG: alpha/beta fold hydrolase [Lentisphaeria bacterium]|nr:alpha/beta fold hydrolase [Lentisphaeria bacterium]
MKYVCIAALIFIILLILAAVYGYVFMEKILFPSPHTGRQTGNMVLKSQHAELDALFLRGNPDKEVILYSHGNGEYLAKIRLFLEKFNQRGYSVMAYDYAGYGGSTGKAGELQAYSDIESAYSYLTGTMQISPEKIVVMGFSVGSGPSSYLASKYPVKALILAAPFASAIQVILPFSLPFDRFPNAGRLSKNSPPLMIFHGDNDWIVPFRNGYKIHKYAAAPINKFHRINASGHNDLFANLDEKLFAELQTFLNEVDQYKLRK